jgi:hypothetical protein
VTVIDWISAVNAAALCIAIIVALTLLLLDKRNRK